MSLQGSGDATDFFVHETACIDQPSSIGKGTKIWHFSHVMNNSRIGANCTIGQNVLIGPSVKVGDNCKIQNNVSLFEGVELEEGVFCGPGAMFTNVHNPRSEISRKNEFKKTLVRHGATIGANATLICGHTIGRYSFIGAGAVVTRDVADYSLVMGNPARLAGYVCECGERLSEDSWEKTACGSCSRHYLKDGEGVKKVASPDPKSESD